MEILSPIMSQSEVDHYFRFHLPPSVTLKEFESGKSCLRDARLLVMALGGPDVARIFFVHLLVNQNDPQGEFIEAHAYVAGIHANEDELAYGNEGKEHRNVGFVRSNGSDITDMIFSLPWNRL
ncbi:MAG: hypothetical protein ABI758_01185 [Candidatus Woesebacteria bacterium]